MTTRSRIAALTLTVATLTTLGVTQAHAATLTPAATTAAKPWLAGPKGIPGHWTLTYKALPKQIATWRPFPGGDGPNEPAFENQCYEPANVHAGKYLVMSIRKQTCYSQSEHKKLPYTGAYLVSQFKQAYGAFQARIYISTGANWPAFWLSGPNWPVGGEIDIMERINGVNCHEYHYGTAGHPLSHGANPRCDNARPGWNTFGVRWSKGRIVWYLNGRQTGYIHRLTTTAPMSIILDNATWRGTPTKPGVMKISYVKVWRQS